MYTLIRYHDSFRKINSPEDNICDYYLINRNGDIFSEYSGLFLQQITTDRGYKVVSLNTKDGMRIQRRVHRLVMMTFNYIEGCESLQVDHLFGDKSDNNVNNCEWVTGKENINRAIKLGLRKSWKNENNPMCKITEFDVKEIIKLALQGLSDEEISSKIDNCTPVIVNQIVYGHTWTEIVSKKDVEAIKNLRYPQILTEDQKHIICKYFQDNPYIKENLSLAEYIRNMLSKFNILNESTYRMSRRLYYRYQDDNITSLYNY
jgi:hypothetical protein